MASSNNEDFWFAGSSTKRGKACGKVFKHFIIGYKNVNAVTKITKLCNFWASQLLNTRSEEAIK